MSKINQITNLGFSSKGVSALLFAFVTFSLAFFNVEVKLGATKSGLMDLNIELVSAVFCDQFNDDEQSNSTIADSFFKTSKNQCRLPLTNSLIKIQYSFYDLTISDDNSSGSSCEKLNINTSHLYHTAEVNLVSLLAYLYTPMFSYAAQEKYQS